MTYPTIAAGEGVDVDVLVWVTAKNRSTQADETTGFWTGLDAETITVDGVPRVYYGAGAVLGVDDLVSRAGTVVQYQPIGLNILTPEVEQLLREYESRIAQVEVHLRRMDPETNAQLSISRVFKGWIDTGTETRGPDGTSLSYQMVSTARALTRLVALHRSDVSHKRAYSSDDFFQYAGVSGTVSWWWGAERNGS